MTDRIKQLEEDIAELKKLLLESERPNVQSLLAKHISTFKTEMDTLASIQKQEVSPPRPAGNTKQLDRTNYVPMTKYAWEQPDSKVRIIFSLEGVGSECSKDQISASFDRWSVEMKVKGYKGQNHIFAIKKLFAEINPEESKFVLKNNSISLILVKKEKKHWDQIQFKEDKFGLNKEKEQDKDPGAGIMNMMKKMYEEGDENMKRTIAEAWTKANDKKGDKPDFSDRYDFLKK